MIPPTQGSSLGAQHNLRNKRFLNFIGDNDILRLNRNGLAQSGLAVAEVKAREVHPNGDLAGVRINLDGDGDLNKVCLTSQAGLDPTCEGPWRSSPTGAIQGTLQRLHDGGRPAGRLGLLRPGPRRPDRQDEDHELDLRLAIAASSGSSTPTRRTSTRSTSCAPTARRQGDQRRRAPAQRRHVQRRRRTRAPSTSTSTARQQACTSTSSTSAPTPTASCATRSACARSTARARRRAACCSASPALGHGRGLHHLHVPPQEHGRGGGDADAAPAGRQRLPQQRHLPPVGVGRRHRLDGAPEERVRRGQVRRDRRRCRSTSRRRGRGGIGLGHAQRDVRERPDEVDVGLLLGPGDTVGGTVPATLALTMGPAAKFGPFTPGPAEGLLRHHDGDRGLHRG